jgi:hypothetical protein
MKEKFLMMCSLRWMFLMAFLILLTACQSVWQTPIMSSPSPQNTVRATPNYLETRTPTSTMRATVFHTETPILPSTDEPTRGGFFWSTGFETGDLSELQANDFGGFVRQGNGAYWLTNSPAHSGNYSAALTIDTSQYSPTGAHAAYLFFWKELPEQAYYYSAWYYIPSNVRPIGYWNLWQWKSTNDGNSDNSQRIFSVGARVQGNGLGLYMVQRLPNGENFNYYQVRNIPLDQWFHIEGYYQQALEPAGQVIVWQDGEEVFRVDNAQTVLSDLSVDWSVNNYSDQIMPSPCTIYVDDIAIGKQRILN